MKLPNVLVEHGRVFPDWVYTIPQEDLLSRGRFWERSENIAPVFLQQNHSAINGGVSAVASGSKTGKSCEIGASHRGTCPSSKRTGKRSKVTGTAGVNMEAAPDRVYLTIREVADYIKVARPTIYAWIAKGVLPFKYYLTESGASIKHRFYRFLKADVDAWMDATQKIPAGLEYAQIRNHGIVRKDK